MQLFLEIQSGPLLDKKFKVEPGLKIGRREGTIILDSDGKVSGLHALIELDNKGTPCLIDQDSANGLVINSVRVRKISMLPGVRFKVGDTHFQVVQLSDEEARKVGPPQTWRDLVERNLRNRLEELKTSGDPLINSELKVSERLSTFTPPLTLEFINGPQSDEQITIAFGPRTLGFGNLDINLKDSQATEDMFQIIPTPGGALFRDLSKGKVQINSKKIKDDQLIKENDIISFGLTKVRISYV